MGRGVFSFFIFFIFFIFFTSSLVAAAQPPSVESAAAQFHAGKYREAIDSYNSLIASHGPTAALCYNLGRAWEESGDRGRAIVNYERAKILAPGDGEITLSLEKIRKAGGLFEIESKTWRQFIHLLSFNSWALLLLGAVCAFALLQLLRLYRQVPKGVTVALGLTCLIAVLTSGVAMALSWQSLDAFVVVSDSARLLLSPAKEADEVRKIRQGRLVFPLSRHDSWYEVKDSSNIRGWLPEDALIRIRDDKIQAQ